jgi:hypothetical protein
LLHPKSIKLDGTPYRAQSEGSIQSCQKLPVYPAANSFLPLQLRQALAAAASELQTKQRLQRVFWKCPPSMPLRR